MRNHRGGERRCSCSYKNGQWGGEGGHADIYMYMSSTCEPYIHRRLEPVGFGGGSQIKDSTVVQNPPRFLGWHHLSALRARTRFQFSRSCVPVFGSGVSSKVDGLQVYRSTGPQVHIHQFHPLRHLDRTPTVRPLPTNRCAHKVSPASQLAKEVSQSPTLLNQASIISLSELPDNQTRSPFKLCTQKSL
jgi:hypothetical protein